MTIDNDTTLDPETITITQDDVSIRYPADGAASTHESADPRPVAEHDGEDDEDPPLTLRDMLATGATYRRLDYWSRRGFLSEGGESDPTPGSGRARAWTPRQRDICSMMMRLIRSGFETGAAARIARDAVDGHVHTVSTEYGITIMWRLPL